MPIITPTNGPVHTPITTQSSSAQAARERAIAKMAPPAPTPQQQPQSTLVQDPSRVSPEEMTALSPTNQSTDSVQDTTTEAQTDATEVNPAEPAAPKADPLSPHYAQLARKEKALRLKAQTQEAQFKAREDALKAREAALEGKSQFDESKYIPRERVKADTLAVLAEEGVSYDEITQSYLNQSQADAATKAHIQRLEAQINKQAQAQEKAQKDYADQQTKAYDQAVNQIRSDVKQLVASNPDFEVVHGTDSIEDVVDLIKRTFEKDGVLLSIEDAAKEVEDYLVEESMKIAKLKKIQQKLQVKPAAPASPTQQSKDSGQRGPVTTLTNSVTASRKLSTRERAVAAFEGKLNKT